MRSSISGFICVKIPATRLDSHLRDTLLPSYLVSGDEPLLVQESLDAIREAARRQGFESRELFVQEQGFDWQALAAAANELSLFAERRIVELRLPTGKPGRTGGAAIEALAESAADDLLVIVQTPKLERSTSNAKWVKRLQALGGFVEVWPIAARDLPGWINRRMQALGLAPDREAVAMVAHRVEGNLLAAQQEIEKLRLLVGEGPVDADAVNDAVVDSSRFDVYQLVDAALTGRLDRALRVLHGVRGEGVDAVVVVWALTRELRTLAKLAEQVESGMPLGKALAAGRVWRSRQPVVRAGVARHRARDFYAMLQAGRLADAVAKGQAPGDAWRLITNLVWRLSSGRERAA